MMATEGAVVRRKDVAAAAGVAPATVSLVLNRHPGISIPEATRRRVFDAAERLGYRPSHVARSLSSGRTQTVGTVMHHLSTPFQLYTAGVLNGAWPVLCGQRYRLLIDTGSAECEAANLFHDKCVDGLLVLAPPAVSGKGELHAMAQARFPAVLVGASLPGAPLDYVDVDNAAAARTVVEALLAAGHRRIAHVTGPFRTSTAAKERLRGYRAALRDAGVAVVSERIAEGDWSPEGARAAVAELLGRKARFTAVFAANDGMAAGAVEALREAGLRVPRDVSVAGIDGFTSHPLPGVELATVRQPLEAIGRAAAERLLERMAKSADAELPRCILLPGEFVQGNTLAPPRCRNQGID